jgi:hypothetical protein
MDTSKKLNILCITEDKELQKEISNSLMLFYNGIDFSHQVIDGLKRYKQSMQNCNPYYDVVIIDIKAKCIQTKLSIQEMKKLYNEQEILAIFDSHEVSLLEYINLGVKEYFYKHIANMNPKRSIDALVNKVQSLQPLMLSKNNSSASLDDILHTEELILDFDVRKKESYVYV